MDVKKFDAVMIAVWPVVAALLSLYMEVGYLGSIVMFFGIPSLYLSMREPGFVKKASIFSASLAIPVALLADGAFHATKTYIIHSTVFDFRVFGLFPVESFFWGFLGAFFPVMVYEYFLHDHAEKKVLYPRMKYILGLSVLVTLSTFFIFGLLPQNFYLGYAYVIIGSVLVLLPVVIELYEHPQVLKKFSLVGAYFFVLAFLYELTALKLGLWEYYTEYTSFLGWVTVGGVKFPYEEVIFWFTLLSFAVISIYDLVDDYEFS